MSSARLGDDELIEKVTGVFTTLDKTRGARLAEVKAIHTTRAAALEGERQRLERKYGPDHPRVLKIRQRQAYNSGFERELDLELVRTQVQAPPVRARHMARARTRLGCQTHWRGAGHGISARCVWRLGDPIGTCLYRCHWLFCFDVPPSLSR